MTPDEWAATLLAREAHIWLALPLAIVAGALLRIGFHVLQRRLQHAARSTITTADDLLVKVLGHTQSWFIIALPVLVLGASWNVFNSIAPFFRSALALLLVIQFALWLNAAIDAWIDQQSSLSVQSGEYTTFSILRTFLRFGIWSIAVIAALDNLGVDVTTLVAGLGVGGVALALATQGLLSDLVGSMVIAFDRPFSIGDFVVVGDAAGTIERIGLKTTRIRSLGGEELIYAHSDLLRNRIENYKRMQERRIVNRFGVEYDSPLARLEEIPGNVRKIVERQSGTRFDRCHLFRFGDSALEYEFVYFVLSPDYNQYMDIQQNIHLEMIQMIAERGLAFAFPSRTLYLRDAGEHQTLSGFQGGHPA